MKSMYTFGARNFILENIIPLYLVGSPRPVTLFAQTNPSLCLSQTPLHPPRLFPLTRYWPIPHNSTQYAIEMSELVHAANRLWGLTVPVTVSQLPGSKAAIFDSFSLVSPFWDPSTLCGSADVVF